MHTDRQSAVGGIIAVIADECDITNPGTISTQRIRIYRRVIMGDLGQITDTEKFSAVGRIPRETDHG